MPSRMWQGRQMDRPFGLRIRCRGLWYRQRPQLPLVRFPVAMPQTTGQTFCSPWYRQRPQLPLDRFAVAMPQTRGQTFCSPHHRSRQPAAADNRTQQTTGQTFCTANGLTLGPTFCSDPARPVFWCHLVGEPAPLYTQPFAPACGSAGMTRSERPDAGATAPLMH